MKKIVVLLLTILFTFAACTATKTEETISAETLTSAEILSEEIKQVDYEKMCVGISVGETGFYSCFADARLCYHQNELIDIEIMNPILLSFRASERWVGGYYVYSYEEIQNIIKILKSYDTTSFPELTSIIETLDYGLLMTQAST